MPTRSEPGICPAPRHHGPLWKLPDLTVPLMTPMEVPPYWPACRGAPAPPPPPPPAPAPLATTWPRDGSAARRVHGVHSRRRPRHGAKARAGCRTAAAAAAAARLAGTARRRRRASWRTATATRSAAGATASHLGAPAAAGPRAGPRAGALRRGALRLPRRGRHRHVHVLHLQRPPRRAHHATVRPLALPALHQHVARAQVLVPAVPCARAEGDIATRRPRRRRRPQRCEHRAPQRA